MVGAPLYTANGNLQVEDPRRMFKLFSRMPCGLRYLNELNEISFLHVLSIESHRCLFYEWFFMQQVDAEGTAFIKQTEDAAVMEMFFI